MLTITKKYQSKRFVDFQNDVAVTDIEIALKRREDQLNMLNDIPHSEWQLIKENQFKWVTISNIENKMFQKLVILHLATIHLSIGTIVGRE